MSLANLNIHHLRNISSARLTLHPQYNIFFGANGSGKTSLLEAIYLLSSGHSFRTREISPLVASDQDTLTVFGRTLSEESISIQKSASGPTLVKLNQQPCLSSSELAHFLPCQVFYQDIFQIIDAGPSIRRSLLDWGLFHVKQDYHSLWKDYRRVIKQRNALLRRKGSLQQCLPWNNLLVSLANELDYMRTEYFKLWEEAFQGFLAQLTDVPCKVEYYKGWDKKKSGKSLASILEEQFSSDCQRQFTQSGAHQADLTFDSVILKAKHTLSRGQQKIILIALKLAQAQLLSKPCIYLFDDITAELDAGHIRRLMMCLTKLSGQFFITTIDAKSFIGELSNLVDFSIFSLNDGQFDFVSRETSNN